MVEWIHESPDGGRTITRRVMGNHEPRDKQMQVCPGVWFSMSELMELGRQAYVQQCLRHEFPVLNSAWEDYHTLLRLVGTNRDD
jgi:hypothetical protein